MGHSLFGVVLLAVMSTAAPAHAECKPAAVPVGDPALVQSVSERLGAIGISTAAIAGCPAVHVHLERRGEQLHLRVADGYQRQGEREVRDVATAAAVIESWTLQEIEDGSLPTLPAPAIVATTPAIVPVVASERAAIALRGASSLTESTDAWLGGELAGCVHVGWACIGASTTFVASTATTDDVTRGVQRSMELRALAIAEIPRELGPVLVSPGLGLGYGWISFAQQHNDAHAMPLSIEETSHSLRARAHLSVSHPLAGRFAIDASLFGDLALARTAISDAPRAQFGLSLGLRFGVR